MISKKYLNISQVSKMLQIEEYKIRYWDSIDPKYLSCPLDVHSGNVARKLGLIKRNQNDHKAVVELDKVLRSFDKKDPVKYDFALFGIGVFEKNDF